MSIDRYPVPTYGGGLPHGARARLGFSPDKFEGLAIVNATTLAVVNDNDFGVESIDSRGRVTRSQSAGRLVMIRIPEPLW